VKPQDMAVLLEEIGPVLPPDRLVVSVAAGILTAFIERRLPGCVPVVRVMSNTPVLVDEAMSVISAGTHAGEEHLLRAEELLRPVGKVLRIPESLQDAATALSGSGPAYVYYLVEAMVDAGILLGMSRANALEMVTQAVYGAATMLRDSGEHPVILREAVTSPGGTTINAIRELEKHSVRAAFLAAIEAASDRSMNDVVIPAATEITSCDGSTKAAISPSIRAMSCGLTARTRVSACLAAEVASITWTP